MDCAKQTCQEIERSIVGALLIEQDVAYLKDALLKISAGWFVDRECRAVLLLIFESVSRGNLPNPGVLVDKGYPVLDWISNGVPSLTMIDEPLGRLAELHRERKIVEGARLAIDHVKGGDSAQAMAAMSKALQEASEDVAKCDIDPRKKIDSAMSQIEAVYSHEGRRPKVSMGVPWIDAYLSLYRGNIMALGAFQGKGKTALAIQCMCAQSFSGIVTGYFCTESSADELYKRSMAHVAAKPMWTTLERSNDKDLAASDLEAILRAGKDLRRAKSPPELFGMMDFGRDMDKVRMLAGRLKARRGKLDLIYLDHLQDMRLPKGIKGESAERIGIGENVQKFKEICEELDCAGVLLNQFSRKTHDDKKPGMGSFRGSGAIDDKCHVMTCLHTTVNKPEPVVRYEFYSVKTRLIAPFAMQLDFKGRECAFYRFEGGI